MGVHPPRRRRLRRAASRSPRAAGADPDAGGDGPVVSARPRPSVVRRRCGIDTLPAIGRVAPPAATAGSPGRRRRDAARVVRRRRPSARGLDVETDRNGNLWAWWGDPDAASGDGPASSPARTSTRCPTAARSTARSASSALAARSTAAGPRRPARAGRWRSSSFADEEGARFGVAVRRLAAADRRRWTPSARSGLRGRRRGDAGRGAAGGRARPGTARPRRRARWRGSAPSSSCTSSRAGRWSTAAAPVGVGSAIWPHGRWRFDLHRAGRPRRHDPASRPPRPDAPLAERVLAARGRPRTARLRWRPWAGRRRARTPSTPSRRASTAGWTPRGRRRRRVRGRGRRRRRAAARRQRRQCESATARRRSFDAVARRPGSPTLPARGRGAPLLAHRRRPRRRGPRRRACRRRCCSCATRPGSRTPPPSTPSATTAWPGCSALAGVLAELGGAGAVSRWLVREHAWLPGGRGPRRAAGGRSTGRIARRRAPARRRPARDALPRVGAARAGQRALARLPPGAARAHPRAARARSGPGGS